MGFEPNWSNRNHRITGARSRSKIVRESFARDPERLARFEREAKTLGGVESSKHRACVQLWNVSWRGSLVMEMGDESSLADRRREATYSLSMRRDTLRSVWDYRACRSLEGLVMKNAAMFT